MVKGPLPGLQMACLAVSLWGERGREIGEQRRKETAAGAGAGLGAII